MRRRGLSARAIRQALDQDVSLTYFYQKQNPAARSTKTMVELMGKMNPRLQVRVVDPDQNPGLANQLGAQLELAHSGADGCIFALKLPRALFGAEAGETAAVTIVEQ